jgi:hypothetical protein
VAPMARDGSLSAAGFDKTEWEIMYPLFVVEGLVDPSGCVSQKRYLMFSVCIVIALILVSFALYCAPSRAFMFCFAFTFGRALYLPSSACGPVLCGLRCCLRVVFHLFINVYAAFAQAFISCSRTRYSIVHFAWACVMVCLLIELLEFCDGFIFYFIDLVGAPGRLDIHSF